MFLWTPGHPLHFEGGTGVGGLGGSVPTEPEDMEP